MRAIMYEKRATHARAAIERFREDYRHLPKVMEYFENQYFREGKTNWMLSERQGIYYGQINTNNYVETWHRTLKVKFFQQKRQKRVDRVIHIISQLAVPYFEKKSVETELGIGRVSKKEKKVWIAHDKASRYILRKIRSGDGTGLVTPVNTTDTEAFEMASFTHQGRAYTITTKPAEPLPVITTCDCLFFTAKKEVCKHIALVMINLPGYEFQNTREPRALVQEALEGTGDVAVGQQEGQTEDEAAEETHPNQEVGDLLNEITTLASGVNWKARLANRESMIESLKRTRDSLKEDLQGAPEHRFSTHRPRQRRY